MTPSTPRRQDFAGHFLWVRDVATAAGATDPTGALPGDMALAAERPTWWLIPLSKWVITPVTSGLTLLIPFITGVITHLLSGMSHQAVAQ